MREEKLRKKDLESLMYEIARDNKNSRSRKFCFVLGAGASLDSGIPSSGELVELIEKDFCEDPEEKKRHDRWKRENNITEENQQQCYCQYYHKRYGDCPDDGYAFLEKQMEGIHPSCGYVALAHILTQTRSNMVITTNFDHLMEDAVLLYTNRFPLVIGHESLAGYAHVDHKRPVIVKIHRDLLLSPISDPQEVHHLAEPWKAALDEIMKKYHLVFMGYGGHDGSLMNHLLENVKKRSGSFPAPYWLLYKDEQPSPEVRQFVTEAKGYFVSHSGFDHCMVLLGSKLDIDVLSKEHFVTRAEQRYGVYVAQLKLIAEIANESGQSNSTLLNAINALEKENGLSAATYLAGIWDEPYEKQIQRMDEALKRYSQDAWVWGTYALIEKERNIVKAEEYYKRAIDVDPKHARNLGNYALFLCDNKKDMEGAEEFYKRAIDADPNHANNLGNYANFLKENQKDMEGAEEFYKRAIDADPNHANNLGNYAVFLKNNKKDMLAAEEFYKRAIDADPKHALHLGNYAVFLKNNKKDMLAAEEFYKRAIDADPKDATILGNYANFQCDNKQDMASAEELYKRAIDAAPKHANNLGNYAVFLKNEKKDMEGAEEFYKRAIDADPKHANIFGNYALFLENDRKNPEQAETIYKIALERCPDNVRLLRLYALFLRQHSKDETQAQELEKRADEIEKNSPS